MPEKLTKDTFKNISWPEDRDRVKEIQHVLSKKVKITRLIKPPLYVAGVDAAFIHKKKVIGTACLFKYPGLTLIEEAYKVRDVKFPYIPGLLSFREGAAIIEAVEGLKIKPDLIIFDGQGVAHPRGLGIASCIGVLLNIPAIGCAKTRLIGSYKEPGARKGSFSLLRHEGRVIGAVVRTQDNIKPVFVSAGHRVTLKDSIRIVLGSTGKYRLTEPIRCADMLSKKVKRGLVGEG